MAKNDPRLVRADAEEHEEKEEHEAKDDASAGIQLKRFIKDMTDAMADMSKRMDAMEHKKDDDDDRKDDDRKDDDRKDGLPEVPEKEEPVAAADKKKRKDSEEEEAEEEDEKPKAVAADKKKRKDDDRKDDDRKDDDRKDAHSKKDDDDRKDAEEEEEEERKDDDRKDSRSDSAALVRRLKRMEEALGDVALAIPKRLTDEDFHALADAQARADEVYTALGKRSAPRYLDGEDLMTYRRRLARDLKSHSNEWKAVNLHSITDPAAFDLIERKIYADAMTVAMSPVTAEPGTLRAVTRNSGGHQITEYVGESRAWMDQFAGPVRMTVTSIANGNQR